MLTKPRWFKKIEFTYIGNLPNGFKFKKTKHLEPINGKKLGKELAKHHIYISASLNEPAGMHHIEGILFTDHLSPLKKRLIKGKLNSISKGIVSVDYKMRFPKNIKR